MLSGPARPVLLTLIRQSLSLARRKPDTESSLTGLQVSEENIHIHAQSSYLYCLVPHYQNIFLSLKLESYNLSNLKVFD